MYLVWVLVKLTITIIKVRKKILESLQMKKESNLIFLLKKKIRIKRTSLNKHQLKLNVNKHYRI